MIVEPVAKYRPGHVKQKLDHEQEDKCNGVVKMIPCDGNNKIDRCRAEELAQYLGKHQRPYPPVTDQVGIIGFRKEKQHHGIGPCDKEVIPKACLVDRDIPFVPKIHPR